MNILGIESSCDETAAAVVTDARAARVPRLLSSVISTQVALHRPFGGVVPEVASRSHIRFITEVMDKALKDARIPASRLGAVAATAGPGLPGSLLVGLTAGKALAYLLGKPFVAVNHTEAHIMAAFLEDPALRPPLLALVASGGHTELVVMPKHGVYRVIGRTRDDAAGEAYDKVAKLLGLGYPGGPRLERAARRARSATRMPVARMKDGSLDFSFSGLKTAVANALPLATDRAALAAGFQEAVLEALTGRARQALKSTKARTLVLAGGVAANGALREAFSRLARDEKIRLVVPKMMFCTDNAAMVACAGWFRLRAGARSPLSVSSNPGWIAGEELHDSGKYPPTLSRLRERAGVRAKMFPLSTKLAGEPVMGEEILLSVVIPVFNERDALPVTLARVAAAPFDKEVVIVDDGSTDGTRDYLDALQQGKESVKGLPRERLSITFQAKNCGKGAALRAGFSQVRGKFVIIQDADLEYDPSDFSQLLDPLVSGRADVVFGTRLSGGRAHRVLFFWHSIVNRMLTLLSNMLTDLNLTDMEVGYKAFRSDLLPRLVIKSNRFGVEPELTARFARMKARIYEVPISYHGRTYMEGKKIGPWDGIAAVWHIVRFRFF